jgi:chromate transporter
MLWQLFWVFMKIGLLSFGGGFSMIPLIQRETLSHRWLSESGFTEAVAIAGMAPGPIATNSAIYIGYRTAGVPGAVFASAGMILPSVVMIVLLAVFMRRAHEHPVVRSIFYGLRPVIAALIVYAAVRLAAGGGVFSGGAWQAVTIVAMMLVAFLALVRFRMHPMAVIALSGLVGIALYS